MKTVDIESAIKSYLNDNFLNRLPNIILKDDDSLFENGIVDSTGVLEMVAFIEQTFDIRVEDEDLIPENLDSINRLNAFIKTKLNSKIEVT
ncbi:acyl carrier protein [Dehalogenimonas etheniformans]|uniref:acyl carrier protein n=1 Tax=Dehalogenimonas etheniformans TaxID=1536648 RepID=UPI00167F5A62|nr:acyl carrier protein [Dehalogenimonas etheniformans]QNT76169.1 acyl carrier protein [Dehalogenimonas etheniformans]